MRAYKATISAAFFGAKITQTENVTLHYFLDKWRCPKWVDDEVERQFLDTLRLDHELGGFDDNKITDIVSPLPPTKLTVLVGIGKPSTSPFSLVYKNGRVTISVKSTQKEFEKLSEFAKKCWDPFSLVFNKPLENQQIFALQRLKLDISNWHINASGDIQADVSPRETLFQALDKPPTDEKVASGKPKKLKYMRIDDLIFGAT
jgi:hypothetical protein